MQSTGPNQTFTFSTVLRRELAMWRQWFPISWQELRVAKSVLLMIKKRSLQHSMQVFVTLLKGVPLSRIFQVRM